MTITYKNLGVLRFSNYFVGDDGSLWTRLNGRHGAGRNLRRIKHAGNRRQVCLVNDSGDQE